MNKLIEQAMAKIDLELPKIQEDLVAGLRVSKEEWAKRGVMGSSGEIMAAWDHCKPAYDETVACICREADWALAQAYFVTDRFAGTLVDLGVQRFDQTRHSAECRIQMLRQANPSAGEITSCLDITMRDASMAAKDSIRSHIERRRIEHKRNKVRRALGKVWALIEAAMKAVISRLAAGPGSQ